MRLLGNILWFLCGGLLVAHEFLSVGLGLCVTIIGIPWGIQCFKLAELSMNPFGKKITRQDGISATVGNLVWIILFGWEFALSNVILGLLLYITIIGIPFGKQFFKLASVSFLPFGAEIETEHIL